VTSLHEHRFLKCPYARAKHYLRESLERIAQSHAEKTIALHVPLGGIAGGGSASKNVIATYAPGFDSMHFDQPWKIHWTPEGGGPYPDFDGELTVRADEDYPTSILELTGKYRPPMGVAGAIFDAMAGSQIAKLTAQELLKNIGDKMEEQYNAEEKTKG